MSVVTLQVWHALKRPPIHHPLFRRVSRKTPTLARKITSIQQLGILIGCAVLAALGVHFFSQFIFVALFFIPLVAVALYTILNGTAAGLYWAVRVSDAIARERERGTLELLAASPYGAFSANWAICTGCQYYDQTFNGAGAQRVWFSRIFFLVLILLSASATMTRPPGTGAHPLEGFAKACAIVAVLALALHIDDIHSAVLGSLIGLIVPQFARNRLDARAAAVFCFLTLQILSYLLVWLIGFGLLPGLSARLALDNAAAGLALPAAQLTAFFLVREVLSRILWRINAVLLDGDVSDLRLLTRGGRLIW